MSTEQPRLLGRRGWAAVVAGLAALAAFNGLRQLGRASFWDDEAFSVAAAKLSTERFVELSTERDPHTALYHLLLRPWVALGGDGEAWVRLPSVIFGVIAVVVFWFTVRRLFDSVTATAASLLMLTSVFFVQYQQEARPYALTVMLSVLSMYVFVRAVQDKSRWPVWVGWGALAGFAVYGHPLAVAIFGAQLLSLGLLPARSLPWRRVAAAVGSFLVLVVPFIALIASAKSTQISWITTPTVIDIAGALYVLTGRVGYGQAAIVIGLFVWFTVCTSRTVLREGRSQAGWSLGLVFLWAALLPLAVILVSFIEPMLVSRYLIPSLPGVMAAVAVAAFRYSDRWVAIPAVAVIVLSAPFTLGDLYEREKDDWRTATQFVAMQAEPGDGILFTYDHRVPFEYYFQKLGGEEGSAPVPISPARPWGSPLPPYEERVVLDSAEEVRKAAQQYQRVWVLSLDVERNEELARALFEVFGPPIERKFPPRVSVKLYGAQD